MSSKGLFDDTAVGNNGSTSIKVVVRVRPLSDREKSSGCCDCVRVQGTDTVVLGNKDSKGFSFDFVADAATSQSKVFELTGRPVVDACIAGYNATIFAYGQTGSGKTFTMSGSGDAWGSSNELRGLIPRVMEHMFERIAAAKSADASLECAVRASYLEVYNETLADLLDASGGQPVVREDMTKGVYVENLTEEPAESAVAVTSILQRGARNRHIGATSMNKESSRSHTVFTVIIQTKSSSGGLTKVKTSRLNLVDLAGSERQKAAQTEGQALKEASQINKSLSAIGNVIMALSDISAGRTRHVHYRDSRLTFILKDSLGGNSRTAIIANISPADVNYAETLSTLQFAQRAKRVQCKAIVNEAESGDTAALQAEISRLKVQLQAAALSSFAVNSCAPSATAMPPAAAVLMRIHACAALTLGPSSPSPSCFVDENAAMESDGGAVAALVGRIGQLELLLKQALEQHNTSEKENVDLRALLHSLGSAVEEEATPQLYHSMVLQLKLRQSEIAALQLQLKASQKGGLDLAAVADEEAALRQENKEMRKQLDNLAHHPHVRNLSMRFALLNAELTVKKVDYDYVHDARCSIQSYNRELRRQALQFAREKEVLTAKLQDVVTRQAATAAAAAAAGGSSSPNRRRSTLLTQQRVALEACEMQQWREQQEFESKQASAAARIAELEGALAEAKDRADKSKDKEVELMAIVADLKERVAERDERILAAGSPPPSAAALHTPSKTKIPFNSNTATVLCLSPQIIGSLTSSAPLRGMSPSVTRPPPSPSHSTSRSDAALAAAEAQIVQLQQALQKRQQEMEMLHEQLAAAQDAVAVPEQAAAAAEKKVYALQSQLQECEMQRDAAEAAAAKAAAAAQQQQEEAEAKFLQLQTAVTESQEETAVASATVVELQETCACAQQAAEFHSERAQQLQLELAEARDHMHAATEQQLLMQQQVESLKQSLAASETGASKELLRLQEAAAAAATKFTAANAAAEALERDKSALATRVQAAETELQELNAALLDARDLIRMKAEAAVAAERTCSDLRFELEGLKSSKEDAEAAAAAREAAAAAQEAQTQALVDSLRLQYQELQEDRESFELFHNSKLEAAMEEVKKRTALADAAATEVSALKAQAQCLQEQLAAAMGDCAVSVERCAALQQQLQEAAEELNAMTQQLAQHEQVAVAAGEEQCRLQLLLHDAAARAEAAELQVQGMQAERLAAEEAQASKLDAALGEVRRRSLAGAESAAVLRQLQGDVQQLQEELAAKEAEVKAALVQAEAAKADAADQLVAATSGLEQQLQEAQVRASLMSVEAAAAAQGLAAAKAENIELKAEVKEWLGELKGSRAAEETLSQQVQLLQQRVVQLQQELATEVAAAAAGVAQIKELNELNVKLSGHNNQQQKIHYLEALKKEGNVLKEALEKANQDVVQARAEAERLKQGQIKLEVEVERHRKALGLKDGALQLMEQQQLVVAESTKAKAALAAATERMLALVPVAEDGDVFAVVEAEVQGLRREVDVLQQKMKRWSMEDKIAARQHALEQQQTSPITATASMSLGEAAAIAEAGRLMAARTVPSPPAPSNDQTSEAAPLSFPPEWLALCGSKAAPSDSPSHPVAPAQATSAKGARRYLPPAANSSLVASAIANFETTRCVMQVPEKLMSPRRVIVPPQDLKNPGLRPTTRGSNKEN